MHQRPRLGLPAVLGKGDLTLFLVLIVVFISNTNGIQFAGPVAFLYWTLGLLTFLVPCAFVTQWLTRRYPGQGAPYLWVSRILGPNWTFFSAFCIWLPGVLAVVSVIDNGLIFIQYLAPSWFNSPFQQCLGIIVILGLATVLTCIPLRRLKHILGLLAILYLAVFALLGGIGLWWLMSGHASATSLSAPAGWQPNLSNFSIYGVIVLAFLGVDIPLFLSGEVRGGIAGLKRASQFVWWGTAISFLAYMAGTFGIMVIVPASQASNMTASVQAIAMVFGQQAGTCADIVIILSQIAITSTYILLFGRILIFVAQDRRLPASLTTVNRHGVPIKSIVTQALIAAGVTILSFFAVPILFGTIVRPDDLAVEIYNVMQAGTTVVWVCSIIQLFLYVLWLLYRRKYRSIIVKGRHPFQRKLLVGIALLGIASSLIGIWDTITSSWILALLPDEHWTLLVCSVILLSFILGWLGSELPRMHALLGEQRRMNSREKALREELEASYAEQQILVDQQQELLAEVGRLYREQAQAAVTDAITGLPNHRAVMSRLEEEVAHCQRQQCSCAVLFVDLDHFKSINDTLGHRAGDAILHEVGSRLSAILSTEDLVGRYGGEEFAIVLSNTNIAGAQQLAERLRQSIAYEPYIWTTEETQAEIPIQVTCSIGIATYPHHGQTREELVEHADKAMYVAKHSGRNCVRAAEVDAASGQQREIVDDDPARLPFRIKG